MTSGYQAAYKKMKPRIELQVFMLDCEARLKENDHKAGWDKDSPESLFRRLLEEAGELSEVLACYRESGSSSLSLKQQLKKEAADVANFAMMISNVIGS